MFEPVYGFDYKKYYKLPNVHCFTNWVQNILFSYLKTFQNDMLTFELNNNIEHNYIQT